MGNRRSVAATAGGPAGPSQASPPPVIDSAGYAAHLSTALSAIERARRTSGSTRAHSLLIARRLLADTLLVRVGNVRMRPDLDMARRDLAAGRLASAQAQLTALRAALDIPSAHPARLDVRGLHALDTILAGPPFTSPPDLFASIGDFLGRLIMNSPLGGIIRAIQDLLAGIFANGPTSTAATVVASLVVAAALVFVAGRAAGPAASGSGDAEEANGDGAIRLDAAGARARATGSAAAGDYRSAARYTYLATLLTLDEANRLRVDEATSNRDVLRQARATPRLAEALTPVVRLFDRFWFGHAEVTREDYERYRQLNDRVLQETR